MALAYAVGLSAVMLLYGLGGRAMLDRVRRGLAATSSSAASAWCCWPPGVLATNLDVRFEEALAKDTGLPAFLVDPTRSLENSSAVQNRLASLRPPSRFAQRQAEAATTHRRRSVGAAIPGVKTPSLPDLGAAPPFTDNQGWFNTPGNRPLTLAGLRGHVVLVDFWTYTCINCIRTLPFVKGLYATYHRYGLEVVGVETPEFTFEQEASNVQQAIDSDGITLPGRPGQQLRHLERLPERVLAGRVPDRRPRRGPPHPVRRGRLQAGRGGGARAALRRPARTTCRRR